MSANEPPGKGPASQGAALPPEDDATQHILERLRAHGAKRSRYQSRGEIARGGMGLILRVWDEDLRRELAMKLVLGETGHAKMDEIPPKVLGRFLEEAQVTGQLDHPGIVPVHEFGLDDKGAVFFTMRLVRGRDMKEIFELVHQGDPQWTLTRALWALLKVCDAMAYAHSKGVVHRDLKPANVMVGRFGEVYVMDWGLARVIGQPDRHDLRLRREDTSLSMVESERRVEASHSADSLLFTMDGDVVGTPAYMAPEQARGEIERLGPRSDVYALGAMLYHLLTSEMPFVTPGARVSQHMVLRWTLEGPPQPVHALRPEVPEELEAICDKAMAREPEQRYADMGELAEDLRNYLEMRVVKAYQSGAWFELRKWVQRNRKLALAWATAIAIAAVGLTATALVQARERRKADEARLQALASEQVATRNAEEARRQEEIARRERSNVLRLSAFQDLEELETDADRLWPAVPARSAELGKWLARAEILVAGLEPGADGDPGHRRQLAELRARGEEMPAEERARRLAAHPRGGELLQAEKRAATLRAAAAVRAGGAARTELEDLLRAPPEVGGEENARALVDRAWPLVDPARTESGREREGLELALAARARSSPQDSHIVADTLAWALFACGLDQEALETSRDALLQAAPGLREPLEEYLTRLAQAVQSAEGPAGAAELRSAEERLDRLEREVLGVPALHFTSEDDRWWYGQLGKLVAAIEAFADRERGLLQGISAAHGWGVARRLEFARGLDQRTRSGAEALQAWGRAQSAIRDRARNPAFDGLELAPQLGLLPIGADPTSGLQEFADVATGVPPKRDAEGRLVLGPESSVVFVLLPGGRTVLGAQPRTPSGRQYDPEAQADEQPVHDVSLAPFFLAKYELTQGQWLRFTGQNPSKHLAGTVVAGRALTELSPVERVSWQEAELQLARLGWRLPTEAQWEYAARAGVEAPWWTGEEVENLQGAANLSDAFAHEHGAPWKGFEDDLDDGNMVHAPVGSFDANPFGLYDVLGNVYEWCRDAQGGYELEVTPSEGERLGGNPATRVVRGGSYVSSASGARTAKRDSAPPELENEAIGIRAMRPIDP